MRKVRQEWAFNFDNSVAQLEPGNSAAGAQLIREGQCGRPAPG